MEEMNRCTLCPRQCKADRTAGTGFCGVGAHARVARAALHMWEEPCISGQRGTGAVFFSGCTLRCCFCQNAELSAGAFGRDITVRRLGEIFLELQEQGAQSLSLISPTPFAAHIAQALADVRGRLRIPVVWNTGGYERPETIAKLEGLIDVYLPDLKYRSAELSARYSAAPDYFERAGRALHEMARQTGAPRFSPEGILLGGTLIRHLVLPGAYRDSEALLRWLAQDFPQGQVLVSVMSQYTPSFVRGDFPELKRRVTTYEYRRVLDLARGLGLEGYCQDRASASADYTPAFDLTGVEPPAPCPAMNAN